MLKLSSYQSVMETLNYWLFLALVAALPYMHSIIRPLWVAWLITWLLEGRWTQKEHIAQAFSRTHLKEMVPLFGLVIWVAWEALSSLWAADTSATWLLLGRHVNFILVAIVCLFGVNEQYSTRTILKTLIITSVLSVGIYLMIHYWLLNVNAAESQDLQPDTPIDFLHMDNLSWEMKHRLHHSTLFTLSLISLVFIRKSEMQAHTPWKVNLLSGLCAAVLLAGIWWSGSRENLLNVAVVACIWALWHTPGKWKWATGAGLVVILTGFFFAILHFSPRFAGATLEEVVAYHPEEEYPAFEPRIAIWHAALEQPSDYLVYGLGAGNATAYLQPRFQSHGWTKAIQRQFSPHSEYLTVCMDLGLVAALLFLLLWCTLPFCHKGRAREFALYATAVVMLNMSTDMYLGVIEGIILTCILLAIISMLDREQ